MRFPFFRRRDPAASWPAGAGANLFRWTVAAYLCLGVTLLFVVGMSIWGVFRDLREVRKTLIVSEMERQRSHALRTAEVLQIKLSRDAPPKAGIDGLNVASEFLRRRWNDSVLKKKDDADLYAAAVDLTGRVVMHSDPTREGRSLGEVWYEQVVTEAGDDVVLTRSPALSGGEAAYDVCVPFYQHNDVVGSYHIGLSQAWLDRQLAVKRGEALRFWGWILGLIAVVVVTAGVSLFQISRRIAILNESVKLQRSRRFAEVGQLMAGIAHEIRNPLNAMRLNLHVLQRAASNPDAVDDHALDYSQIIRETNQEIERVEGLIRILLGYARPDQARLETLDVRAELQVTLSFLKPMLERAEVAVRARFADAAIRVVIDRDRLRQIVINLVNNASEAAGTGGQVDIVVLRGEGGAEIAVADDGPGVSAADRERVFEPFYSTKENGTGLGLALVRRYVEEAGGTVVCEENQPRGARFRLRFPEVPDEVAATSQYPSVP